MNSQWLLHVDNQALVYNILVYFFVTIRKSDYGRGEKHENQHTGSGGRKA